MTASQRNLFPDTKGEWVPAEGNPLVEIRSDGVNVGTRPTGFDAVGQLDSDGDRAAFEFSTQRYFWGDEVAEKFKANLSMFTKSVRPADSNEQQTKYFDAVDAKRARDAADFERAITSGKFDTPPVARSIAAPEGPAADTGVGAPPNPSTLGDQPATDANSGTPTNTGGLVFEPPPGFSAMAVEAPLPADAFHGRPVVLSRHDETGQLAATVEKEGRIHHVFAALGEGIHHLVERVEEFFGKAKPAP